VRNKLKNAKYVTSRLKTGIILLVTILGLCFSGQTAHASAASAVSVVCPVPSIAAGQRFVVNINISPNIPVAGLQFNLNFDASLVTIVNVAEGALFKQSGASTYFSAGEIDNTGGTIKGVYDVIVSPGKTVSSSGTVAVITLNAKSTVGVSSIKLSAVIVGDSRGQPSPISLVNGQISISSTNLPPILANIGTKSIAAGQLLQFTISASDPNGNKLVYAASNLPPGASFNSTTQTFSWTPSVTQVGTYTGVRFQVSDGSLTAYELVTITVRAGVLVVTSPNGSENWAKGITHNITWTSSGSPGANVKIELLKAGVVNIVIASTTPNDGAYTWTTPATQTLGTDYRVRITSTSLSSITDASNANFTITSGVLVVTSANGGENWARGITHNITWTSSGSPGANVKIELLKAGVVNTVIASSTPNDGAYTWTTPVTQTLGTDYRVRITSTSFSTIADVSNANFAIN
jgi:5-hydroxyisourate hydrolase-like protein (transthyretin family)